MPRVSFFFRLFLTGLLLSSSLVHAQDQQPNPGPASGVQQPAPVQPLFNQPLANQPPVNQSPQAPQVVGQTGMPPQPTGPPGILQPGPAQPGVAGQPVLQQQSLVVNDTRFGQVLGLPSSFCGHVIDRLIENQMRQNSGVRGTDFGAGLLLPGMSIPAKPGDLQLQTVQLMSEGNGVQGPIYLITLQNHSSIPVGDFRITLVGVSGTIQVHSPTVTGHVQRIDAGAAMRFEMQLPSSVMTVSPGGQCLCAFDTLVAVVDSFDELLECDELNNVLILSRTEIPPFVTQPAVVVSTVPVASAAPEDSGGATRVSGDQPDSLPTPGDQALPKPSPLDGLDVDKLQPGEAQDR